MALTTAGKEYIANTFGLAGCFVKSGLTWTRVDKDGETSSESGGTAKVIIQLTTTEIVDYIRIGATNYYYADLKAANGGNDVTLDDITWIAAHDEPSDSPPNPYCIGVAPTTGFLTVNTSPTGASVSIDGTSCGTTPVTACVVPVGTGKTVTITKIGYQTETRTVNITEGVTTDLGTITLTPEVPPGKATLHLGTHPGYANYFVYKLPDTVTPYATGVTGASYQLTGNYTGIEIDVPATYRVRYEKDDCTPWESGDVPESGEDWIIRELSCTYTYFATFNVKAYEKETSSEIHGIASVGTGETKVSGLTPCSLKVSAPATGSKVVTLKITGPGRKSWSKSYTIAKGDVIDVDAYMEQKAAIIIHITEVGYFIDDFGGGTTQIWAIGTTKRPGDTNNWVSIETSQAEVFQVELAFYYPGGAEATHIPHMWTEKKAIAPGMTGAYQKLRWPYSEDGITESSWKVEKAYEGKWEMWGHIWIY